MVMSVQISDMWLDRSFYHPGERLLLTLAVEARTQAHSSILARATIRYLAETIDIVEESVDLAEGLNPVEIVYTVPPIAPRGYGLDVCLETPAGLQLACSSTAFDVLERWTQTPRYGFVCDFFPGRGDAEQTMADLARYHINGLQFYDWMYRHDTFLTDQEPYLDPLGRQLSRTTVEALIAAAHEHNIAAMPYTAVYAASVPFYQDHPDWALYQANGKPYRLGEDFLIYMDPRPGSPWMEHLLAQFGRILEQTAFDGIHLDQYGDPKQAYDARGNLFDLAQPLADAINATSLLVRAYRPDGAVVFNAVNNWPIETVAPSAEDLVYIEVWPPHIWFQDLHSLILGAQELGNGKPVVLAAYIEPSLEHNVRLVDAVIFASGGAHIELGERGDMLADPYFPRYQAMSPHLADAMRRYYDFAVRYQDVIGARTSDATEVVLGRIELEGASTEPRSYKDKVWPIARRGEGFLAVSLINLLGVESPEWARAVESPPSPLGPTTIRIRDLNRPVSRLWFASPDVDDPSPQTLPFEVIDEGGSYGISFQIPALSYWDLLVLEWGE